MTREQDPGESSEIEQWADRVAFAYSVLPMNAETFRIRARLMRRRSETRSEDAMIATTAIQHGLTESVALKTKRRIALAHARKRRAVRRTD